MEFALHQECALLDKTTGSTRSLQLPSENQLGWGGGLGASTSET